MEPIIDYINNLSLPKLITRLLITITVLCIVGVASFFVWDYFINQKIITLKPTPGTTIAIGTQIGDNPVIRKEIAKTTSQKEIRLRPGVYAIKFSGSKDYKDESRSVAISKSIDIKTPNLKYTDGKLTQLLSSQKNKIHEVLQQVLPSTRYLIDTEKLFNTGQWYGARLMPDNWYEPNIPSNIIPRPTNNSNTRDILRLIMKKEDNKWRVVAGPSVIMYIKDYENIPQDIIRSVNKFGF